MKHMVKVMLCLATVAGLSFGAFGAMYYVKPTATGTGDGTSWENAMAWKDAYAAARAVTGPAEIWLCGDVTITEIQDVQTIASDLTIRGGFNGTESKPEHRSTEAVSTFTSNDKYQLFRVNVTGSLTFESVVLTHGCVNTSSKVGGAVEKSGAGSISFYNCQIRENGRTTGHTYGCTGAGLYLGGSGEVIVSNTLIAGNGPISYPENSGGGWGVYVKQAKRAYFDDCQFVTNCTKLGTQTDQYSGKHKGAALWADGVPVTVRNCRFAGNAPRCGQTAGTGAVVYLGGGAGKSAFTNCVFVGNQELLGHNAVDGGGIVRVDLSNAADPVDFSGCTFAYNLTQTRTDSTLAVVKGSVHVTDSTFFHNLLGYSSVRNRGTDIHVQANGRLSIEKTSVSSLDAFYSTAAAANVTVDMSTMSVAKPNYRTAVPDCEAVLRYEGTANYPGSVNYANDASTFAKLAAFDTTVVPSGKPDVGEGNVLYVKGDATGAANGSSWANAFTTLDAALAVASEKKNEIWIAGDLMCAADAYWRYFDMDLVVRGGFSGSETDPSDRETGARSTLDGAGTYDLVKLSVHPAATVTFERCNFTRARYRAVQKHWYGNLRFANCDFLNNGRAEKVSGRAIQSWPADGFGAVSVSNCVFAGQMYNSYGLTTGNGGAVCLMHGKRFTAEDSLFVTNGMAKANQGADAGGSYGAAVYAYSTPVTMRGVRVAGNCWAVKTASADGGIVALHGYVADSAFTNCAFVGNYELRRDGNSNPYGGALVFAPSSASHKLTVQNCTFAYNVSQGSGGASALTVTTGDATVKDCIFWQNPHGLASVNTYGSEIDAGSGTVSVSHTILTATDITACHGAGLALDPDTVYTLDPLFVTSTDDFKALYTFGSTYLNPTKAWTYAKVADLDVHLLSPQKYYLNDGSVGPATNAYSKGVDKGDPSVVCVEPDPNGGRVNLGAYGNTKEASLTAVGQPSVKSFAIDYKDGFTRPYVTIEMGIASGAAYFAEVTVTCKVDGVVYATRTFSGVQKDETLTWGVPHYFETTDNLEICYGISADGATPLSHAEETTPDGKTKPAFCGHGGGGRVIHVREGADCGMDGSNWEDAYPTLAVALSAGWDGKDEIWIARTTEDASSKMALAASLAIRGGFSGTEDSSAERPKDSRTTFAYGNAIDGFTFNNAEGATLELDRLVFDRATTRAVVKQGAGDLVVRDCQMSRCGRDKGATSGKALYIESGSSKATITVTNTVADGNMECLSKHAESGGSGAAFYVASCKRLIVDDSLFVSNGMEVIVSPGSFYGGINGGAIYASATPVTARRTRFTANALGNRGSGGVVVLVGACGGSAFTNCAFVGNYERMDNSGNTSDYGGALTVNLGAAAQTCEIEGCTIAYNVTDGRTSAGGLTVLNGKVTVHNSIIWGNYRSRYRTSKIGEDIDVKGGTCYVSHSLVTGTDVDKCRGAAAGYLTLDTENGTVYTGDPCFVSSFGYFQTLYTIGEASVPKTSLVTYGSLAALDAHLLSSERYCVNGGGIGPVAEVSSPMIDKGDPDSPFDLEIPPNGGRVNLGAYGNTPEASATPSGVPCADSFEVTLPTEFSRPRATLVMGIAKGSDYKAAVTLVCSTGGVDLAEKSYEAVQKGAVLSWDVPFYFLPGTDVRVTYRISAEGADDVTGDDTRTSDGKLPDFYGRGGGARVVHVRAGADCLQDGTSWTDAYADLGAAMRAAQAAGIDEVWVSTNELMLTATVGYDHDLVLRGGFIGSEDAPSERPEGLLSQVNNIDTYTCLSVSNDAERTFTVERMRFTRALNRAIAKTGPGDLVVRDSVFANNGCSGSNEGRGIWISGNNAARLTVANCQFVGNMRPASDTSTAEYGGAVRVSGCAQASLADCLFASNGMAFVSPQSIDVFYRRGAALSVDNTPVSCDRCRFVANGAGIDGDQNGAVVAVWGKSGGSVFRNCVFVGNYEALNRYRDGGAYGGAMCVNLSAKAQSVLLQNCTFAHNVTTGRRSAGGLNVTCGTVTCLDTIFWKNRNGYIETEQELHDGGRGAADDIMVQTDGALYVTNTLVATTEFPSADVLGAGALVFGGTAVTNADPLFVTDTDAIVGLCTVSSTRVYYSSDKMSALAAINVHLRGGTGYHDEATGEVVRDYARRGMPSSPAIDRGRRIKRGDREPSPCGVNVNLGAYGNTPWATMSKTGGYLIVR